MQVGFPVEHILQVENKVMLLRMDEELFQNLIKRIRR